MGFFLSTISDELSLLSQPLHKYSHPFSRVRQYHGIFKSECTDFLINQTQYEHIFCNKDDLSLWGNNKTANALQLFSGLTFYAQDCSFKSKVRFLFMLFDFNEIKSISIVDLEYMFLSICDFTYKVLGKINTKTDQIKLAQWLAKYLNPRKRITVTRMYRLCAQANQIWKFLYIAGATRTELENVELTNIEHINQEDKKQKFEKEEIQGKIDWFTNLCNKITKPKYKEQAKTNPHLTWVYGIEINSFKNAFIAIEGPVLLYAVSNKMIVLNAPNKHQLIYDQHSREITAFCMRRSDKIVASAEGKQLPHIYIWNYQNLQTIFIIRLDYSPKIKLMCLSDHQPILAVIGQRQNSPVLLIQTVSWSIVSSLRLLQSANQLQAFTTVIPSTNNELQGCFVICGANTLVIVDQQGQRQNIKYQNQITALAICQLNSDYPYLRLLSLQKLCLFIVTGHKNGSVNVYQQSLQSQDNQIQRYEILNLSTQIIQLIITPQALFVCTPHQISIYNLTILLNNFDNGNNQEIQVSRTLKLSDLQQLKLMSKIIHNISVTQEQICILSKLGDLVVITDRQVSFDGETFKQNEGAYRIPTLVKFDKEMRAMCFLEKELHSILLVISGANQLMQIDPESHQIDLVLTIKVDDFVNVIDSAVTEEGTGVIVSGCRSGKLIIRYDWEQIGKVIQCGSEVSDLKISPQGSALLVATTNTLLLFHLGPNISSPRKLQFYNQTPLTLNFLDNSKFCAVSTSARNVYLIELPALKHRSVFKQVQNFAASELSISYPRENNLSKLACPNIVGGDMKFYIITLQSGGFIYFPSMSSLQRRNYLLIDGHCSPISNLTTNEDQTHFFTLGHQDSMLLQWSVQLIQNNQPKYVKNLERYSQIRFDWEHYFKKIKKISEAPPQSFDFSLSTFFIKGTKSKKLNRRLKYDLNIKPQTYSSEELALSKRHCNYSIKTNIIYGLQNVKINQTRYKNLEPDDSTITYSASRFLLEYNKKQNTQKIFEYGSKRVAYFEMNQNRQVVWAQYGQKPWIWIGGKRIIQTTHQQGLLHFCIYKDFILSYGIDSKSYTINLHNICNRKLIAQRTTDRKISSFLLINQNQFVSFSQVRRWSNFVVSQIHGFASAATVLPNGKDICLGGFGGQLSVLCQNTVVQVARQAHTKQITLMKTNKRFEDYELITASQDQTIKIWNQYFQQLYSIDLKIKDDFTLLIQSDGDAVNNLNLSVCSLDCKGQKILVGFSHGQIWEFIVSTQMQNFNENLQFESSVSLKSDMSQNCIDNGKSFATQRKLMSYKVNSSKLLDAHTSNKSHSQCYVCFDVHSSLPLLATSANDGRLVITDYEQNKVLANYLCGQKNKVTAIRFSPKGRMLVVGMSGGNIQTFYVSVLEDKQQRIIQLTLQTYQPFKSIQKSKIIQIQFDITGQFFSVSYWIQQKKGSDTQVESCHIKVFRIKSQKNNNIDEAFYQQKQIIETRLEDKVGNGLSKIVLSMHWKNINNRHYILFYSEYNDSHHKLKNNGKYEVYSLQQKSYLSDEFMIEWIHFNFANLLNIKTIGPDGQTDPQKYAFTAMHSEQKLNQRLLICGGLDGRLHLLHKQMLYNENQQIEERQQNMYLSRVYNSHSSFITRVHIAKRAKQKKRYLFVTAYGDQTIVQYQLIEQDPQLFLQYQVYPKQIIDSQILNQCPSKQHFYLMLNNRQPLRQQLTSVVQDVEKKINREIALKPQRIFGRRAFDRRYNLAFYKNNALYSIGPNIVIQSLNSKNQSQQTMKADPSPLSHYPQISSFDYDGKWLAITTQEQRGMLYIWDVSSRSCLNFIQLECSVVLMIRFCGDQNIVLYGFNYRYEMVVLLLNWRAKKILGRSRMVHSGNWILRDISAVNYKKNNLEFVTCGNLHLCYWELRGDSLVYNNFNSQHKAAYVCVKSINHYIVTGCQKGLIYLWLNFQLVHILRDTHRASLCCFEVDSQKDLLFSAGKDGVLFWMKIQDNKLTVLNKIQLYDALDINQSENWGEIAWKVEHQIQSIALSVQPYSDQFDKILVGTRSGAIYSIEYNQNEINIKPKLIIQGHDHQNIIGGAFSTDDKNCFFTLSNAGVIDKWSINQLKKIYSFDLGRRALKIQNYGSRLLICFRNQIAVYRDQFTTMGREQYFCIDTRKGDNQASESRQSEIIRMCFSSNGKNLAVCIKICTKQPLYQINIYQFGQSTEPVHITYNFKHQIDYIDFSTDDKYLLFKDRYEEIGMLTLYNKEYKRINTIFVEMNIEWQEEGLRISPHAQKIYYSYSCQNKITAITKLGSNRIVIGDQMGTIRIFDYPCPDERLGELHLQCYSNHMNDIHFIKTHPEFTYILTAALQDRSLILWKVVEHPKQEIFNYL